MAGTGKSTIAQTVALECEDQGILGGSFFFSTTGEANLRTGERVISTLVYQMSQVNPPFKERLEDILEARPDAAFERRERQAKTLLIAPLQALNLSEPLVIVLDALDEYLPEDAVEILNLLLLVVAEVQTPLKLLITSRPEPYILSVFSRSTTHGEIILHNIEDAVVREDIRHYLRHHLLSSTDNRRVVTESDVDQLLERSGHLCIYAATAVRFILDDRFNSSAAQLRVMLDASEAVEIGALSALDSLYLRLLAAATLSHGRQVRSSQVQTVLSAIILTKTPLPLDALEKLLGLRIRSARATLYPLQSVILTPQTDSEVASIYHQSFSDFLTDPTRCTDSRFSIGVSIHERGWAIRCLTILKKHLKRNIAGIPNSHFLEIRENIPNLDSMVMQALPDDVQYACRFWADHVSQTELGDEIIMGMLTEFAQQHAIWWLEAMGLLSEASTGVRILKTACDWATTSVASEGLIRLLHELQRLIRGYWMTITAGPLQIYASVLPYTPRDTELWASYRLEALHHADLANSGQMAWPKCMGVLRDHRAPVTAIGYSADGSRIASASNDGAIIIWDTNSGKILSVLEGQPHDVNTIVLSPDGSRIVSQSREGTVHLWDGTSGVLIHTLSPEGMSREQAPTFTPNGFQLVVSFFIKRIHWPNESVLYILNATSGATMAIVNIPTIQICHLVLSPDGSHITTWSFDGTTQTWDSASGGLIATRIVNNFPTYSKVAFAPDGSRFASSQLYSNVKIISGITRSPVVDVRDGPSSKVVFSPDGLRFTGCTLSGNVRLWDSTSGEPFGVPAVSRGYNDTIQKITFSPDGLLIVSTSTSGTLDVFNGMSGSFVSRLKGHSDAVNAFAFSPDGQRIISASEDATVRIWDAISAGGDTSQDANSRNVSVLVFSPSGTRIAILFDYSDGRIWDIVTGIHVTLEDSSYSPHRDPFARDGLGSRSSPDVIANLRSFSYVSAPHFSPDGALFTFSRFGDDQWWDVETGQSTTGVRYRYTNLSELWVSPSYSITHQDRWLFRLNSHQFVGEVKPFSPERLCYIPEDFKIRTIASFPPGNPTRVAIACEGGYVLVLDLSPLLALLPLVQPSAS